MDNAYILEMNHITKRYGSNAVLRDVSLQVRPGEIHALLGENGAGKSTLIKILSGVYTATEGEILLDGKKIEFKGPRDAMDKGISVIHQELSIAKDLTVAQNIFLGEEQTNGIFLDNRSMNARADELLKQMKMDAIIKSTDVAGDLTAAQQQMVEIARVINKNAKVVIMDEPTSSLSEHEIDALFEQIRILRDKGVAIAYISHRMKEIFEICDRATVLRDGCFVRTDLIKDITEHELVASMVGREIDDYFVHTEHTRGEETLRVEGLSHGREFKNVSFRYADAKLPVLEHISFTAEPGQTIAIMGETGCGKTSLIHLIPRFYEPSEGEVLVDGVNVNKLKLHQLHR